MAWLLVLLISNFSSAAPSCPTERQLSANFTRESLEQFIQSNRVKDLDDLTCCMARIPGAQIAIAPHSIAAQNGDTQNPRVLVVIPRKPPFPNVATASRGSTNLAAVFSVNSGAAHLNQKDNLEVMINGSSLSYVDVESTAHHPPRVSRANPPECMSCHGNGGVPSHGPRPIFEAAPWPSFIMENPDRPARAVTDLPNSRDTVGFRLCTYREQLEPEIEKASAEALQRHPRYHCIKDLPKMNIAVLDLLLVEINVPRIVRFITQSKDYEMFKFAILAAEVCADFKPEDYIPGHVRGTMNQQTTIDPRLLSLSTREQLRQYANRQTVLNNQSAIARDTRFRQDLPRLQRGERVALEHRIEDTNCVEQMPAEMISPHNTSLFQSRDSVFNRYHADSGIRPHPNVNLRYIFESRGIEISDWNMTPTGGYDRRFNIANELLKRGNFSQEVRVLARRSNQRGGCDRLKALSMRAFEKHHPPAPSESPPVEQ